MRVYVANDHIPRLSLPWVVDRHPVISVLGFVLLGALVGTDALLNPLFKFTLLTDDLARHVHTYHVICIIFTLN